MTRNSRFLPGMVLLAIAVGSLWHCSGPPPQSHVQEPQVPDSLYQMMRLRVHEMKTLRRLLMQQAPADSLAAFRFPFDFADGVPSEGMQLSPMFPAFSEAFSRHYEAFYQHPSVKNYNQLVRVCENCHQEHCPGPLRLIDRLYLPEEGH